MKSWVGIYRGREGKAECSLLGEGGGGGGECENVNHVLWECSALLTFGVHAQRGLW